MHSFVDKSKLTELMIDYYSSFEKLMIENVLPFSKLNNTWIRLDGQNSGGNRQVYAFFSYKGKIWKIHSDTHFEELIKAYTEIQNGNDPFIITSTRKANSECLELRPELVNNPKHIYIYFKKIKKNDSSIFA